jgi:hypothetical protein
VTRLDELFNTAFIDAYNDLVEAVKEAKARNARVPVKDKSILICNVARMSPLAHLALEIVASRRATIAARSAASPPAGPSGRARAALRAYQGSRLGTEKIVRQATFRVWK